MDVSPNRGSSRHEWDFDERHWPTDARWPAVGTRSLARKKVVAPLSSPASEMYAAGNDSGHGRECDFDPTADGGIDDSYPTPTCPHDAGGYRQT